MANGCFVCAPNRIGHEIVRDANGKPVNPDGIEFWGQSFVAAPDGSVMARASVDREEVLLADCDLARVEFSRTHWPFLRDRRVDATADLTKRSSAVTGRLASVIRTLRPRQKSMRVVRRGTPADASATASRFPPSGSATPARGSAGLVRRGSRFPAATQECIDNVIDVIRAITPFEPVHLNVPNIDYEHIVRARADARRRADCGASAFTTSAPTSAGRAITGRRSCCARVAARTEAAIVDWGYNAWGGKYPPYDADDAVPTRVARGAGAAGVLSRAS